MNPQQELLPEFSLVRGAPSNALAERLGLATREPDKLIWLGLLLAAVSWVPLLVLALAEGQAWDGAVALPFLRDAEVHVRSLLAVPLLIVADVIVQQRMQGVAQQFLERGLIPPGGRAQFDAALARVERLRTSKLAETVLILLVYGVGVMLLWRTQLALDLPTWYGVTTAGELQPSLAGWWLGLVTLPIFQFLVLRWYYRLGIWWTFLWQISRIDLQLMPKHPDGAGGIGFLARTGYAFGPFLAAQTIVLSGTFANRIFFTGAELTDFKLELTGLVALLLIFVLTPVLFFSRRLEAAKRAGLREGGRLIARYLREFDARWVHGDTQAAGPLLGSPDLQSLADLGNAYAVVRNMRWVPLGVQNVAYLAAMAGAPFLPLAFTMFRAEELLDRLLKILF